MLINCEKWTALDSLKIYRIGEWDEIWITKLLVKDLDKGSKAISGARSIADDGLGWVVGVCIDSYHVGRDVTLPRGSNEHLLSPSLNVLACTLSINKHPGPFDYQVDLQVPALVVASSFSSIQSLKNVKNLNAKAIHSLLTEQRSELTSRVGRRGYGLIRPWWSCHQRRWLCRQKAWHQRRRCRGWSRTWGGGMPASHLQCHWWQWHPKGSPCGHASTSRNFCLFYRTHLWPPLASLPLPLSCILHFQPNSSW